MPKSVGRSDNDSSDKGSGSVPVDQLNNHRELNTEVRGVRGRGTEGVCLCVGLKGMTLRFRVGWECLKGASSCGRVEMSKM